MYQTLPKIPVTEYRQRWAKVQGVLKAQNLDMMLLYADDRFTYGNAYGRYFCNVPTAFEPVLILFTPGKDPVLLVGPETPGYAREVGAIEDIRELKEFAAEHEDYLYSNMQPLKEIVASCVDHQVHRIGLGAKNLMSADIYETILANYPNAEYVNVDSAIDEIRAIKSPAELEVIRYAYKLVNMGIEAAIAAIRPGVSEREVAAEAEYVMRKNGAEGYGIDTMVCSGPNADHILARTTTRIIREKDMVVLTFAPRYEGYHAACARVIFVGEPDLLQETAVKAMSEAQILCGKNLMPGKVGADVEALGRSYMTRAGYGENLLYSGLHSVGVTEFEPPILGPSSKTIIRENMVISVDIPLHEAKIHGARIEDGYIITAGGAECLTNAPHLSYK